MSGSWVRFSDRLPPQDGESEYLGEAITDHDFKRRVEKAMDEIWQERQYIPLQRYGQ